MIYFSPFNFFSHRNNSIFSITH